MSRFRIAILGILVVFLMAPVVRADEEAPDPNEVAEDYAKEFKKNARKMPSGEVIEGIDRLVAMYKDEKVDDRGTKKDILDALSKVTSLRDNVVIAHLMEKCGELDEEAVKLPLITLKRELSQKVPDDTVYEAALESLGKLRVENKLVIKTLTDLLNHKDSPIIARACRAMTGYAEASGRTRKELFEEVLKASEGTYSAAQANDETYKRKWAVIGDDVMDALVKLSNVALDNPIQARSWFNDNKKESWDREDER